MDVTGAPLNQTRRLTNSANGVSYTKDRWWGVIYYRLLLTLVYGIVLIWYAGVGSVSFFTVELPYNSIQETCLCATTE